MFDSEEEYTKHKSSRRHMLCVLNSEEGDTIIEALEHFYCILCNVQYTNVKEYLHHFFEEKHMSLSNSEVSVESKVDLFHCQICNIVMDEEAKDEHIKDRKHLKKVIKNCSLDFLSELVQKDIDTSYYKCQDCNIFFSNFMSFSDHLLQDASHLDKLVDKKLSQN